MALILVQSINCRCGHIKLPFQAPGSDTEVHPLACKLTIDPLIPHYCNKMLKLPCACACFVFTFTQFTFCEIPANLRPSAWSTSKYSGSSHSFSSSEANLAMHGYCSQHHKTPFAFCTFLSSDHLWSLLVPLLHGCSTIAPAVVGPILISFTNPVCG